MVDKKENNDFVFFLRKSLFYMWDSGDPRANARNRKNVDYINLYPGKNIFRGTGNISVLYLN